MSSFRLLTTAFTVILAGGCASVPVNYYSLLAASTASPTGAVVDCCRVLVTSVKVPPSVDRPEIVVRRSDDQLSVLGNDLWISPLRDELMAALTEEIRSSLSRSTGSGSPASDERAMIHIDVERFESVLSQNVLIQIAWRVSIPGTPHDSIAACETSSRVPVGVGVDALIRGHQKAIAQIGAQIAAGVISLETAGERTCGNT